MKNKKYILFILLAIVTFIYFKKNNTITSSNQREVTQNTVHETEDKQQKERVAKEIIKTQECEDEINKKYSTKKYDPVYLQKFLREADIEIADFISINWNELYKKPQEAQPKSRYGLFFQAVAFSGQLSTTENKAVEVQLEKSILSYKKTIEADPQNSYLYYYLASTLIRANKYEEANHYLIKAMKEPRYESYINDISRKIYVFSLEEPKAYFQGTLLYSSMPTPSPKSLENIIEFMPKAAEDLGKKMTRAAEMYKDAPPRFWSQLEHAYGRKLLKKTFSKEFYNTLNHKEYYKTPSQDIDKDVFLSDNCTQKIPSYIQHLKQEIKDLTRI